MNEKEPIILKAHQGQQIEDEKIGEGFETEGRGIRRKKYETEEGSFVYADKEISSEQEAKRVMGLYQILKEAGLPVTKFAKRVRKHENGEEKYYLAMEDLTDDDRYKLFEIGGIYDRSEFIHDLIIHANNGEDLSKELIRALAIMHNLGIVDFHPGLSFVLRMELKPTDSRYRNKLDFRIIDYSNLTQGKLPNGWSGEFDFDVECRADFGVLLGAIAGPYQRTTKIFTEIYQEIRERGDKKY